MDTPRALQARTWSPRPPRAAGHRPRGAGASSAATGTPRPRGDARRRRERGRRPARIDARAAAIPPRPPPAQRGDGRRRATEQLNALAARERRRWRRARWSSSWGWRVTAALACFALGGISARLWPRAASEPVSADATWCCRPPAPAGRQPRRIPAATGPAAGRAVGLFPGGRPIAAPSGAANPTGPAAPAGQGQRDPRADPRPGSGIRRGEAAAATATVTAILPLGTRQRPGAPATRPPGWAARTGACASGRAATSAQRRELHRGRRCARRCRSRPGTPGPALLREGNELVAVVPFDGSYRGLAPLPAVRAARRGGEPAPWGGPPWPWDATPSPTKAFAESGFASTSRAASRSASPSPTAPPRCWGWR